MEVSGRRETSRNDRDHGGQLCQPCRGEGDEVPAEGYCENCNEYFCSSCLKVHRKMAVTKNHVIKSKDEMPTSPVKTDPCVQPCDIHKSETVKYYCHQHDSVGCGDCMVIDHKTCKVELVSHVSGNYGNSGEIKMIKESIEEIERRINLVRQEMKGNLKTAADMKAKIVDEIRHFRKELNAYLDQTEAELLSEVEQLNANDVDVQKDLLKECDSIESEVKVFQEKIDQHEDKINQLFVTVKLAKKRLETYQESVKSLSSVKRINSYSFEPSEDLKALQVSQSPFGALSVATKTCTVKKKKTIADMKAHFLRELNVRAENESKCLITGMAIISSGEILLADFSSKSLKVLNIQENKIVSRYMYSPPVAPWDVTIINADESALTLPVVGKILFMNTTEGLSESHTLDVKPWCKGIDYHNGKIAVSYTSYPAVVEVLNMEGEILHHSDFPTNRSYFPGYLCFSKDGKSIFVSDETHNTVQEHSAEGQLKTKIAENLKGPSGLVVTRDGTIVVCDHDGDTLSMIVPTTRKVIPLFVKHVNKPRSVLICEESNQMYISEYNNKCIKVFDLK
ncbi:protein wech-like [Mercenaria mercenaria]|uniref:protein wech-like n=1 Tax=Mercenaria mercenaria TaxID=6596 RepID=UPI00234EA73E|nr:protein wech-like [Mercenaria mercenaria]